MEINVREYRRGNPKRTIQRNWQHRVHKTKINKTKTIQRNWQHRVHKTKKKTPHNTICVGHHYTQTNTQSVNKTCTLIQTT
jgi:hypothetical protein